MRLAKKDIGGVDWEGYIGRRLPEFLELCLKLLFNSCLSLSQRHF